MTVNSLKVAREVVEEAGPNKIEAVFQYTHAITESILYAVFMKNQYIDIYQSRYCECIHKLFEQGEWIK